MEYIELEKVKPASYNPRILTDEAKEELKRSLTELGCIKPIIVNRENMIIIAGHQRTKTMLELGIKKAPAFIISGISEMDEVRFNQLHNRCEYEINPKAPKVKITANLHYGFNRVKNDDILVQDNGELTILGGELCRLLSIYGDFGAPVCDKSGNVIISSAYAAAAARLGKDLDVYCIEDEKIEKALSFFSKQYGKFYYENIPKTTYHQGLCQMRRLRSTGKTEKHSRLYEKVVIPFLKKNGKGLRILDFGAGAMDYAKLLKAKGYDIHAIEPYHFKRGWQIIDFAGNTARFMEVCKSIKEKGLYDVVICDSVLNSVDTLEAESAVIFSCKALTKIGGHIFMSGRTLENATRGEKVKITQRTHLSKEIKFLDENGFTALYRNGGWQYQKFHSKKEVEKIGSILGEFALINAGAGGFYIHAQKKQESKTEDYIKALRFEFDMPLPNGKRYGLQEEITKAYENRLPDN